MSDMGGSPKGNHIPRPYTTEVNYWAAWLHHASRTIPPPAKRLPPPSPGGTRQRRDLQKPGTQRKPGSGLRAPEAARVSSNPVEREISDDYNPDDDYRPESEDEYEDQVMASSSKVDPPVEGINGLNLTGAGVPASTEAKSMREVRGWDAKISDEQQAELARKKDGFLAACKIVLPVLEKTDVPLTADLTPTKRDRVNFLNQHNQYREMFTTNTSDVLGVNTNEPEGIPRPRAATCWTMSITESVLKFDEWYLIMFCDGLQQAKTSTDVVFFLLAQLLARGTLQMPLPDISEPPSLQTLLDLLVYCLRTQIKYSRVYLLIDSISELEDKDRKEGTVAMIKALVTLAKEKQKSKDTCDFKLVITSRQACASLKCARDQKARYIDVPRLLPRRN